MFREKLRDDIRTIVNELWAIDSVEFEVTPPTISDVDADYSSNVAFKLARILKRAPKQIAEHIAERLSTLGYNVQVAGNGFLNIKLTRRGEVYDVLTEVVKQPRVELVLETERAPVNGKRVLLEFVSANPTGPLNVVSGRAAVYGDVLGNLLERFGHEVIREYYVNDLGGQIEKLGQSTYARVRELQGYELEIPEGGYMGEYLRDVARDYMRDLPPESWSPESAARYTVEKMVKWQKESLERFGVRFDSWVYQSSLEPLLAEALSRLESAGLLYEQDNALVFRTTRFGDDKDRVIRKSDGSFTYFAYDIAYILHKFRRGFDMLLTVLGPDHHGYVKRLEAATQALGYRKENHKVIIHQLVTLLEGGKEQRMSKRKGKFVTLDELVQVVGRDVARYFFLTKLKDTHLDFDIELAKQQSTDNPVYYVKYAHARICSIFRKAGLTPEDVETLVERLDRHQELDDREWALLKAIDEYPNYLMSAYIHLEPYYLTLWAYEAAYTFHKFYDSSRVIGSKREDLRLVLCLAFKRRLEDWAELIGIELPEHM